MEKQQSTTVKKEEISDLLNSGSVFGMGFSDSGNYELSRRNSYEMSNCFRPCHNQPGPCICYSRQRE